MKFTRPHQRNLHARPLSRDAHAGRNWRSALGAHVRRLFAQRRTAKYPTLPQKSHKHTTAAAALFVPVAVFVILSLLDKMLLTNCSVAPNFCPARFLSALIEFFAK